MSTVVMRTKRVTTMRGTPRRARRHTIERASADATRGCTMWARDRPTRACTSSTRVTLRRAERERTADRVARASCADRDPYRMPRGSDTHPNARDAGRDEARRSAPGFGWCCGWCGCGGCGVHLRCACGSPERIRTAVTALRGRRPRPLDDGAVLSRRRISGLLGGEDSNPQRLDQNQLCCRLHHPRMGAISIQAGSADHRTRRAEAGE